MPARGVTKPPTYILKFIKVSTILISFVLFSIFTASPALAAGTVSGTIKGPHGETAVVNYTFTKGSTTVTGSTNSSGVFSQSLAAGDWTMTVTPPTSFTYADSFTIPTIRIEDGDAFDFGVLQFYFQEGDGVDELEEFGTLPSECSQSGTPVIIRAYYTDESKGSFLYQGGDAGITVVADGTNYTVTVDYSFLEGYFSFGNVVETATHQGNGTYTVSHTIQLADEGGGFPLISVTDGSNSTTKTCLQPGPVNLDIRNFLNGSETTDFTSVSDFRAIQNFTMHTANVVKITFSNNTVNMLDPTVQRFMKSIGDKMIASKGNLNLDANAVLELKNAGAVITWYGLTDYLTTPTILLDGADAGTSVSGVTYDRSAGTLTFDASHFSVYTAVPSIEITSPKSNYKAHESIIDVKGNVNDSDATVNISVNGVDQGDVFVDSEGNFSKDVHLSDHENVIKVNATNNIGSALTQTVTVNAEDPDITVNWPHEDYEFTNSIINVRGMVSDSNATVTLKVDGRDQGTVAVASDGSFDESVEITDYENTITIDAKNDVGNAKQRRITVFNTSVDASPEGGISAGSSTLPQTGIPTGYLYTILALISSGILLLSLGLYAKKISYKIL